MKRALLLGCSFALGLSSSAAGQSESWLQAEVRRFRSYPHLDRAYRLIDAGDLEEARRELRLFLAVDPADREARLAYVDLSYRLGDFEETVRAAGLLLERDPDLVAPFLYRGLARIAIGETESAFRDFRVASELPGARPADRTFAITTLADLAIERRDWAGALGALDAMPATGRDESYFARRGACLEALARLEEAEAAYRYALDRTVEPARRADGYRALGEVRKKRRDWRGAREAFAAALALDRDDVDLLRNVGEMFYQLGDYSAAAERIGEVVTLRPDSTDREFLAHLLLMKGEREAALAQLQILRDELRAPADRLRVLSTLGEALADSGRWEEAARAYREALALEPSGELHLRLGLLHAERGDDERALEELELADRLGLPEEARASARRQQGTLLSGLGRHDESLEAFEENLRLDPGDLYAKKSLAIAYEKTNRLDDAVALYEDLIEESPKDATLLVGLGHVEMKRARHAEAAVLFERAFELDRKPDPFLLASWGEALFLSGEWEGAIRIYHRLLASGSVAGERRAEALERLGYAYVSRGNDEEAAFYLETAIDSGRDHPRVRQNLGLVLHRLGRFQEALDQFLAVLDRERTDLSLVYAARCLEELGRPGLAIHYLLEALPGVERFESDERIAAYNELGFLYANEAEYARAADAWSRSLQLRDDPEIALRLGRAERLSARFEESRLVLEGIDDAALSEEKSAERLDELSRVYEALGLAGEALDAAERAGTLLPSADRYYRLGLLHRDGARWDDAALFFRSAVLEDPRAPRYAEALGFALDRIGATSEAIARFESVVARDRDYLNIVPQLGYLYMRVPDNEAARKWFELAIDNEPFYPVRGETEEEELRGDVFRFRREVAKLSNEFDFGLYTSLRSDAGAPPPAAVGPSALPSQGGVELSYQPPGWGFRNERLFQAFVRVLWNHETESLAWDPESFQGGFGVRYKPLRTQNLLGSFERLFAIGESALNNWLARGLYSWNYGYELRPGVPSWRYTLLHGEAGYLLRSPKTLFFYGEGRQGWTFNVSDSFLLTPHVVVAGRNESSPSLQGAKGSYVEAGPGVSFKLLFREGRYYAQRSSLEVLLQYRSGRFRDDSRFGGWVVIGSMQF